MRLVWTILALGGITSTAGAQAWTPELGVQGGATRVKPAGTGLADAIHALNLPSFSLGTQFPAPPALYAIVPLSRRLALEPSLSAAQLGLIGTSSAVTVGLRLDYAVAGGLYAALGGVLAYREAGGAGDTQVGLQAALGFRMRLVGALHGRLELHWQTLGRSETSSPKNAYSALLGLSSPLRGAPQVSPRGAARWHHTFGMQGGYASYHIAGLGGFSLFSAPGLGGAMYPATAVPIVVPPTLFAVIPVTRRFALESGIDVTRLARNDTSFFAANLLLRVDYAFDPHWYGAGGIALHHLSERAAGSASVAGVHLAAGYRFALTGVLGARVEASYVVMARNAVHGVASQTFALLVGVTTPLR